MRLLFKPARFLAKKMKFKAEMKKRQTIYQLKYGQAAPDPSDVIYLDPNAIEFVLVPRFQIDMKKKGSYIIGGNWDINNKTKDLMYVGNYEDWTDRDNRGIIKIEDYGLYKSFREHFCHDISWEETEFYHWILDNMNKRIYRYESEDIIHKRLNEIDKLYKKIKQNGYKTQKDLSDTSKSSQYYDEILVNIGRDGRFILDDGRHRLIIAKILDLHKIPVRIFVRHSRWQNIRHQIANKDVNLNKYTNSNHPDINNLVHG